MSNIKLLAASVGGFLEDYGRRYFECLCRDLPDKRGEQGRERVQAQFVRDAVAAKLAGVVTLRGLEQMTELSGGGAGGLVAGGRMPDSTMSDWLEATGVPAGHGLLVRMASDLHRRKILMPNPLIGVGGKPAYLVNMDGKQSFKSVRETEEAPYCRMTYRTKRKQADGSVQEVEEHYWAVKMVRGVVATEFGPLCAGIALARGNDEQEAVRQLTLSMMEDCRFLRDSPVIFSGDAAQMNKEYLLLLGDPYREVEGEEGPLVGVGAYFAIKVKKNCRELYGEAVRAGQARMSIQPVPDAEDDWQDQGHGRRVKREGWLVQTALGRGRDERTVCRLDDYEQVANVPQKEWPTIRQFLVVRQTIHHKKPPKDGSPQDSFEYRVLAVNIKRGDVDARTLLTILRLEWQVEAHHNLLDVVLREDDGIWTQRNQAPLAIAALNSVSANLLVLLKKRHLRSEFSREILSYPQLAFLVRHALLQTQMGRFQREEKRNVRLRRRPQDPELPEPVAEEDLPQEYTRQWSDQDSALLLGVLRHLFRSFAERYVGQGDIVTLVLQSNMRTKEVQHNLQVD